MKTTRHDFLKICGASAAALGLSATDLGQLKEVLADPNGPTVIWLQGSACTGCSVSFLDRIADAPPLTAAGVLVNSSSLIYHLDLATLAGDSAVAEIEKVYSKGGYVLAVEGAVPTKFGGKACLGWSDNDPDVTFHHAVVDLSSRAVATLCVGTCASFGGIPAPSPNPTGVKSVSAVTGKPTINIAGCPTHPDWIVYVVAQILLGNQVALDPLGRPKDLFTKYPIHDMCMRRAKYELGLKAQSFGIDNFC